MFYIFVQINILLKPLKTFLRYLSVLILGQRVDVLRLSLLEERLEAISKLTFLRTLKELKTYISLVS